jgi:hypothetical protein
MILFAGLTMSASAQVDSTAVEIPPPTVEVQPAEAAPTVPFKDLALGSALSYVVPGGGHLYAGEIGTGVALATAAVVGGVVMARNYAGLCIDCQDGSVVRLLAGAGLFLGAAAYSMADGERAVWRANLRNGHPAGRPRVAVGVSPGGVAMRVRL